MHGTPNGNHIPVGFPWCQADELEALSSLIKSYWDGDSSENQTAPVFKFELDELLSCP